MIVEDVRSRMVEHKFIPLARRQGLLFGDMARIVLLVRANGRRMGLAAGIYEYELGTSRNAQLGGIKPIVGEANLATLGIAAFCCVGLLTSVRESVVKQGCRANAVQYGIETIVEEGIIVLISWSAI